MRTEYQKQLEDLHTALIEMGARCEEAISCAVAGLLDADRKLCEKAQELEKLTDLSEREIDFHCVQLFIKQQPIARDLRQVMAAQRMVRDMERIGDQAADIAALALSLYRNYGNGEGDNALSVRDLLKNRIPVSEMAEATAAMLTASMDSFVHGNLAKARETVKMDDRVDELFRKVKQELFEMIMREPRNGGICLDLLMIAKYLERIGDHSVNIAQWVVYAITGDRDDAL
jgi:phosphate transport system protein